MDREELPYTVVGEGRSAMGRSTVELCCPFCQARVTAYRWSLAGSGKRCDCGAKFTNLGLSTRPLS